MGNRPSRADYYYEGETYQHEKGAGRPKKGGGFGPWSTSRKRPLSPAWPPNAGATYLDPNSQYAYAPQFTQSPNVFASPAAIPFPPPQNPMPGVTPVIPHVTPVIPNATSPYSRPGAHHPQHHQHPNHHPEQHQHSHPPRPLRHMSMPIPTVSQPSTSSYGGIPYPTADAPVIPPPRVSGTPFPRPNVRPVHTPMRMPEPVIPPPPVMNTSMYPPQSMTSSMSSSPEEFRRRSPQPYRSNSPRRRSRRYRSHSEDFGHHPDRNPLPTPPKDVFAHSPYMGLLEDLKKPPEESTLRRHATVPRQFIIPQTNQPIATAIPIVVPGTSYQAVPNGSVGSSMTKEKKRKGLFRSLSAKMKSSLGSGSHHRHHSQSHSQPNFVPQQPILVAGIPVPPSMIYAPSPASQQQQQIQTPASFYTTNMAGPTSGGSQAIGVEARPPTPQGVQPQRQSRTPSPRTTSQHNSPRPPSLRPSSPRPPPVIVSAENSFAHLLYFFPHPVHYERKSYPSAYHLFEALKFIETRPDISEKIRTCRSPEDVEGIVSEHRAHVRGDWEQIMLTMMDEVLYMLFIQHPTLRSLLYSTGLADILVQDSRDDFWGGGPEGQGGNELGKSLMRVRERLRNEGVADI
ncbi:hypothetical protein ABKN59_003473 [Abortiporus biennis]